MYYLSGKMSDMPNLNFPEFHRVATVLRDVGMKIYNPAEEDTEPGTDKPKADVEKKNGELRASFLRRDILLICSKKCEGVIAIPSWKNSEGAKLELAIAFQLGLPTFEYRDAVYGLYDEEDRDPDEDTIWPDDVKFLLQEMEYPVTLVPEVLDD